ncbi:DoxX family protein [Pseudomonas sp. TH32]|uniref:DoxX family protein n=1 Tax=Pseudomonas sp. TH32 TaxID=2796397 RepID=UPI0019134842|nr:DoxX family protein [Pseudomonas sp. TH32]MBK5437626.1 DoxX family protein [Pseudomonas sp. TH32]
MTTVNQNLTLLFGRALLVALFLFSGIGKLMAPSATLTYIAASGAPFPSLAYGIALVVELGLATALLLGYRVRPVALLMAAFTLMTALLFHNHFGDKGQLINFQKNLAICGGFLQIAVFGAGSFSLDHLRSQRAVLS